MTWDDETNQQLEDDLKQIPRVQNCQGLDGFLPGVRKIETKNHINLYNFFLNIYLAQENSLIAYSYRFYSFHFSFILIVLFYAIIVCLNRTCTLNVPSNQKLYWVTVVSSRGKKF